MHLNRQKLPIHVHMYLDISKSSFDHLQTAKLCLCSVLVLIRYGCSGRVKAKPATLHVLSRSTSLPGALALFSEPDANIRHIYLWKC